MNTAQLSVMYKKPVLVLTVGLPRSGKSTWAMQQGVPVVNPDSIRKVLGAYPFHPPAEQMVWAIAHTMVSALFTAGHKVVILDATNTTQRRRAEWASKDWVRVYKVFETSAEVCTERALADPTQKQLVDNGVIMRMLRQYEPVGNNEGDKL